MLKKIGFEIWKFFEKPKNRKFWKSIFFRRVSIEIFRIFGFSIFRKISIEILRKIFDFQNFRFFDFRKFFQLRRFFSTKIYATFPLIFFLNRFTFFRCLRKIRREIARTQCRGVRERWVKACFVPKTTRNDKKLSSNWWICTRLLETVRIVSIYKKKADGSLEKKDQLATASTGVNLSCIIELVLPLWSA